MPRQEDGEDVSGSKAQQMPAHCSDRDVLHGTFLKLLLLHEQQVLLFVTTLEKGSISKKVLLKKHSVFYL